MPTNHRRDHDAPGSIKAHDKWHAGLVRGLLAIENYAGEVQEGRPTLTAFRIKCDADDESGVLVVGYGYEGSVWMVCFHREETVSAAVAGFGNRLRNGSLKWKVDEYANTGSTGLG